MSSRFPAPTTLPGGTAGSPAEDARAAAERHGRRWLVLAVVAVAQLMVVLDATIVNIALPSAQRALGFPDTDRQWVVTAYALAFGSLLLLGGKLGDLFGRKTAFITGLVGFAGASALGGAAGSFTVLIAARALQGVFGALLAPAALSTLATTFTDPKERSRAFGVFGAVAGGGSAVGLVLGGLLTEYLSWRWCLYVNLVFAAAAILGAALLMVNSRGRQRPRLDIPGTVLASAGLFCLVFGFSHASTSGWADPLTIGILVLGAVLLTGFVLVQQRVAAPLLPLRVVLHRVRGTSYLAVGLSAIAIFGVFLFLTYYLQQIKGYSPVLSGLSFLPMTGCIILASTSANILLLPRTGPRPLVSGGMALGAVGMFLFTRLTPTSGYPSHVLPSLCIVGLGFGLIFAPAISSATFGVAPADAGVASAMVNTMQQVGGSVGTALLSTLAASSTAAYARSHHGPGVAAYSAVHGYTTAFTLSAVIFAVGAVLTGLLLPSGVLTAAHAQGTGPQLHDAPSTGAPTGVDLPSRNGRPSGRHERPRPAGNGSAASEPPPSAPFDTAARPSPLPRTDGRGAIPMPRSDSPLPGPGRWSVTGRVQQPDGTGQPDAVLTLLSAAGEQLDRTRADASGSYRLTPPAGGTYLLICAAPGFQPAASTVAVAGTDIRRDITLTGATRITGRLRSGTNPIPDGLVTLMDGRGQTVGAAATDSTGTYLLGGLTLGEYTLTATASQHRPEVRAVHLPTLGLVDLDIDLIASGAISGTIRAASDGRALPESTVTLLDPDGHVVANGLTDDHGRYSFPDLVPGSYTLTASGFAPVATQIEVTSAASNVSDIKLGHPTRDLHR